MIKINKFIGRVLSALLIFCTLADPNLAYAEYTSYEIKQVVYTNLNQYSHLSNLTNTQSSLLNSLSSVSRLYLWTSYIFNVGSDIASFNNSEKEHYLGILKTNMNSFNDTFGNEGDSFTPVKFTVPDTQVSIQSANYFITEIANYVTGIYEYHLPDMNAKETDEEKSTYYNDNKITLDGIYTLMLKLQQDYSYMRNMLPYQTVTSMYTLNFAPISGILSSEKYKDFFSIAEKNLEQSLNSAFSLDLSEGDTIIDKFSAVLDDGDEKQEAVNSAYLAALSASSLYMPLESKIGDTNVVEAIKFLCDGDTEVADLYANVARKKKPLYLRTYKNGAISGSGELAVLGDIIDMVISGKAGALVTVEGSFKSSEDGNSYEMNSGNSIDRVDTGSDSGNYVDNSGNTSTDNTTDNTTGDNTTDDTNSTTDSTTNSTSNTVNNSAYAELIDDESNVTVLESSIGEGSPFTESPALVFGDTARGDTNTLVITNYFLNTLDLESELAKTGVLYVNPFGDIVLADNTVIIPAASNASYYTDSDESNYGYNPFTEMFMEGYPKIGKQSTYNLVSKKDEGKIVLTTTKKDDDLAWYNKLWVKMDNWILGDTVGYYVKENGLKNGIYKHIETLPILSGMINASTNSQDLIFLPEEKDFGGFWGWANDAATTNRELYRMDYTTLTVEGMNAPLFPYGNSDGDEALIRSKYIVQSFFASLVLTDEGMSLNDNGRFDVKALYNIMCSSLDGMYNANGFQKTSMEDLLDEDSKGVFYKMTKSLIDFCRSIVDLFGDSPGLLGLRSAVQDPVMGQILYYAKLCLLYIFIVIALLFIANYIRRNLNITYVTFSFVLSCVLVYAFIYFIPRHLSTIVNFLPGDRSNQLAFESLMLRQENNMGTTPDEAGYKDFGVFNLSSSSINLYKLSDDEMKDLCDTYGVEYSNIVSGGAYELDSDYGLYVEGDSLKLSLDKFLNTVTVQGSTVTKSNLATYVLDYDKNVSNVIDYYMPYYLIIDGLISRLNTLSSIYEIPRNQYSYTGNLRKDAFLMDSYIKSPVFLSPEDYRDSDDSISDELLAELQSSNGFGENNVDFLGLHDSFSKYLSKYEGSLWYDTMVRNGYIGEGEENTAKYSHLIEYVNSNVKKFLMDNMETISFMSDETAIEITALYTVMIFNNQVSEFGSVLYPQNLNYSEATVVDILRPVVTKDYNKFYTLKRDIIDYCYSEFGFVGVVGVTFAVVCASLISLAINYSIYILYLLLAVFVFLRFLLAKKVSDAFKGFLKIFGSLILVYFINIAGIFVIQNFTNSGLAILFLILLNGICLGLCVGILSFVVTGFGALDFGNTKVNAFVSGLKDWSKFFKGFKGNINSSNIKTKNIVEDMDELDYNFTLNKASTAVADQAVIDEFMRSRYSNNNSRYNQQNNNKRKTYRNQRPNVNTSIDFDEEDELL